MHKYKQLSILVEGPSDQRFFDRIIKPRFEREYGRGQVRIIQYSEMKNERVISLINGIKASSNDCICVADIDKAPCVSQRKQEKQEQEFKNVDRDRIIIVVKEIEGWYLAGLTDDICRKFGFPSLCNTDEIGKGQFSKLQHEKFSSRIHFMREILRVFDTEVAKKKNKSFGYFAEKYGL